jgi:uncharacterized phage protein (TIGR01671 family)
MKELKFRHWNTIAFREEEKNKMIYSDEIAGRHGQFYEFFEQYCPSGDEDKSMQFAGVKDKNGKEIYEGDIIEWEITPSFVVTFEVKYLCDGQNNGFFLVDNQYVRMLAPTYSSRLKVIGNIIENKELLKNEKRDRK